MIRTAHDHFREAEQHVAYARQSGDNPDVEHIHLKYAQVHATLALAATNGANRTPTERPDTRTMSDPPAQGEEITDQMGGQPEPWFPCPHEHIDLGPCCEPNGHQPPHVDAEGREFR
jgi:hypothetical protein